MTSIRHDGQVVFRFYRPDAKSVNVVGCFNGWNREDDHEQSIAMQEIAEGWWQAVLNIEAGEYRFRYIADSNWFTDFAATGVEKSKYGWNSVLIVPERRMKIRANVPMTKELVATQDDQANEALAA